MEAQQLERLFKANRRDTLSDITLKFNENNVNPVAKRTLLYHLHGNGYKRRVQRKKLVIKEVNRKKDGARKSRDGRLKTIGKEIGKELFFQRKVRL